MPPGRAPHVVVVGGGITGLAAALQLRSRAPAGTRVTVVEQSAVPGGKLRTGTLGGAAGATGLAGLPVEDGAETFLARVPEAVALAREVGLGDDLVHPATTAASVVVAGRLRPLPARTLLGVPADVDAVAAAGVLSDAALARVRAEPSAGGEPLGTADVAVGGLVGARLGREVVDRLVDPLLGGVYAGRADTLSLDATVPALAAEARRHGSLVAAAGAALDRSGGSPGGPVFASVRGGLARLAAATATASGADVRCGLPVRAVQPAPGGWRLVLGSARYPEVLAADAVVLAVPARPAARLLGGVSAAAAAEVGGVEYASVALVSLALPPGTTLPRGSGLLVPAVEGLAVKAVTFLSQKWPGAATAGRAAAAPGVAPPVVVRASVGRFGEEEVLQRDDATLAGLVAAELRTLLGPLGPPLASAVTRWGGALPQYAVGHLDRVRRARSALAGHPTLALAGAAYDGVGVPACIRSGRAAADQVAAALRAAPAAGGEWAHG